MIVLNSDSFVPADLSLPWAIKSKYLFLSIRLVMGLFAAWYPANPIHASVAWFSSSLLACARPGIMSFGGDLLKGWNVFCRLDLVKILVHFTCYCSENAVMQFTELWCVEFHIKRIDACHSKKPNCVEYNYELLIYRRLSSCVGDLWNNNWRCASVHTSFWWHLIWNH